MEYREFKDGIRLSVLGMGNMRLPETTNEQGETVIDYDKAKEIIDAAMKAGINYYDTAYIYHNGKSEEFVGKALAEYPRDSYYVATKFNFQAQPDYRLQFEEQLNRLQMDYIDFYLLHGIQDNFADDILASGCISWFDELKKQGKIRYLGFSFHASVENMEKMLRAYPWDFVQIQLNYYDWEYGNQRKLYEMLTEAKIPIMVMEPVHGGLLARMNEKSGELLKKAAPDTGYATWAMRWIKSLPGIQVALSGMSNPEQLADNVKTFSELPNLNEEEKKLLKEAAGLLRPDIALPCTGCRYCCPNCPMELDIPTLLISYNDMKADSSWRLINLNGLPEEKRPSACVGCGACTAHCPQSLPVPDAMREMAEIMAQF
ncbi:MAG: aldo/keto reductase [Blautia sp.]|nr:aldo/keto reductase [Blautia sp.]